MRANGRLVWANFGLLFFVVLLPFATEVLGSYRFLPDSYRFLDLLAIALGLVNFGMWWYATLVASPGGTRAQPDGAANLPLASGLATAGVLHLLPHHPSGAALRAGPRRATTCGWRRCAWGLLFARPPAHPPRRWARCPRSRSTRRPARSTTTPTAELDVLRDDRGSSPDDARAGLPQHGEHGPAHQLQRQRVRLRHHVARHALRRAGPATWYSGKGSTGPCAT